MRVLPYPTAFAIGVRPGFPRQTVLITLTGFPGNLTVLQRAKLWGLEPPLGKAFTRPYRNNSSYGYPSSKVPSNKL